MVRKWAYTILNTQTVKDESLRKFIAIPRISANNHKIWTSLSSQKEKQLEKHIGSHLEEHPAPLLWICAKEPLPSTRAFQWDSDRDYTVEYKYIEHRNCPADFSLPLHGATSYYPLWEQNCRSDEEANQFPETAQTSLQSFHLRKSYSVVSHPTESMTEWSCSWAWKVVRNQQLCFLQANRHKCFDGSHRGQH